MPGRAARKSTLYTVPDSPDARPALLGGHCSRGHVFFPAHRLGCDVCGALPEEIEIVELAASGVLKSVVTAHRQRRVDGSGPLVVGTVLLDDGPAVEVVLDADDAGDLSVGQRVHGTLVEGAKDEKGRTLVDLVFEADGDS